MTSSEEHPKETSVTKEVLGSDSGSTHDDSSSTVDGAWRYLDGHRGAQVNVDMKALRRKIDWHIVPLMFLCYTMQFLDKVILNVCSHPPAGETRSPRETKVVLTETASMRPSWA